ncbi:uncharacterized protein DUF3667 [Winogradskyella wandonensis]|uniref:Uncharacterized protein DUF3667 n=1 Tax=Winogradskyella wandonensis TaxID=1442586 RepID=A0A4R1KU24_9FLAO|nr:DUF3667 domain-containing protein [Winogradskyella wandonensis]TCK68664.1 uncharacterized protein DUF3667 [Winogradskyella wandonensis]
MHCKNCEIPLSKNQNYCFECGARVIKNRLTIKALFQQINAEFLSMDNKLFKTFIHLFTKPEAVIVGYINGTRKKYINVIQYFAIALTFLGIQVFLMEHWVNNPELYESTFFDNLSNLPGQEKNPFFKKMEFEEFNSFQSLFYTISIPFSALATWLTYWLAGFRRYNFTEHVVLNLYYGAQIIIISAFFYIAFLAFGYNYFTLNAIISILTFFYLFYVLKRVFSTSFWLTLGHFILMFLVFFLILVAATILVGVITFIIILIKKGG